MKTNAISALATLAACALVGCTAPGGATGGRSQAPADPSGAASATAATAGVPAASPSGAAEAGIDPSNPPKPVGSIDLICTRNEAKGHTLHIDVFEIERRGKVAVARFAAQYDRGTAPSPAPTASPSAGASEFAESLYGCDTNAFSPRLIDTTNLVMYSPVTADGRGSLSSDQVYTQVSASAPAYLTAVFPAPKDGVTTIDMAVNGTNGYVKDVPVK